MLKNIGKELLKPKNQVRFILAVISGDIVVNNRKRAELFLELKKKGYEPSAKKKIAATEPIPKKKITAKEPFLKKKTMISSTMYHCSLEIMQCTKLFT